MLAALAGRGAAGAGVSVVVSVLLPVSKLHEVDDSTRVAPISRAISFDTFNLDLLFEIFLTRYTD